MSDANRNANPQSIKDRLRNYATQQGVSLQAVLTNYAIDRTLYRLGRTEHASYFVLKGAQLLRQYANQDFRSTLDADLVGPRHSDDKYLRRVIRDIAEVKSPDGLMYDLDSIRVDRFHGQTGPGAYTVRVTTFLGTVRNVVRLDVGQGDAIVPAPVRVTLRPYLDQPAATLTGYAPETVVAEKLHATSTWGSQNSRLKDLYDLLYIARSVPFDSGFAVAAIRATFRARGTPLDTARSGFVHDLCDDPRNKARWLSQYARFGLGDASDLPSVCEALQAAYGPLIEQAIGIGAN